MYNISFEGVSALKRASVVLTFRTVHSARLWSRMNTQNMILNTKILQAKYTVQNVQTTLALFRANIPSKEILYMVVPASLPFSMYSNFLFFTPCKASNTVKQCWSSRQFQVNHYTTLGLFMLGFFFLSLISRNFDDWLSSNHHRFVILCIICWDTPTAKTFDN